MGRPCESTTRPCSGQRGFSRTICGGIAGVLVSCRSVEANPSAWTVSPSPSQAGSMNRPVWNRPAASVLTREPTIPVPIQEDDVRPRDRAARGTGYGTGYGVAGFQYLDARLCAGFLKREEGVDRDRIEVRHEDPDLGTDAGRKHVGSPSALSVRPRGDIVRTRGQLGPVSRGIPPRHRQDPCPRNRPALLVPHRAADRHPALQGHRERLGQLRPVPIVLDRHETRMGDGDLDELVRIAGQLDRESPLVVGRSARNASLAPRDADPRPVARQWRTIHAADDFQVKRADRLRLLGRLRLEARKGRGRSRGVRTGVGTSKPAPIAIDTAANARAALFIVVMIVALTTESTRAATVDETTRPSPSCPSPWRSRCGRSPRPVPQTPPPRLPRPGTPP